MGEREVKRDWTGPVMEFVKRILREIPIEAIIVHGSAVRSGLGPTSDIDVIVVSNHFSDLKIDERIGLLNKFRIGKIEALGYTFSELESMVRRANPLALGALIEGVPMISSERIRDLMRPRGDYIIGLGGLGGPDDAMSLSLLNSLDVIGLMEELVN